ncbi:hypothetical protein VZH09_09740 [Synechococcus elongatus IITB7]|uniref:hypothetical protein n=1 Tax=Synechococcus elongatus TaxID=32046 RepID=UPI0030D24004
MNLNQVSLANENFLNIHEEVDAIRPDYILKSKKLTPYQAYIALKKQFGLPNSNMFDDIKTQWMYALQTDEANFEIYDWKIFSWSIAVYLKPSTQRAARDIAHDFASVLERQAFQQKKFIAEKLKNPDGFVIENPFFTYRETADSIYDFLENIKEEKFWPEDSLGLKGWMKHYDLCRAAFVLYLSSVEAFVNLIYELYLRKELREKRIYDRLSREQIDLKLRLAPVYCECFRKGVLESENDAFKNFHSLANIRNDIVHANLTKPMMNPVVYEDSFKFVNDVDSSTSIGIPSNFREFESEHIRLTKTITQTLIDYVVVSMKSEYKREFNKILHEEYIEVEYDDGKLSIL